MSPEDMKVVLPHLDSSITAILVEAEHRTIYIADGSANQILVIDLNTGEVTKVLPTGRMPVQMVLSEDKQYLFVYNLLDGTVSQIDVATGETIDTFNVSPPGTRVQLTMTSKGLVITSPDGQAIKTLPASAVR